MILKLLGWLILLLIIVLLLSFLYVGKIATGSEEGKLPEGYTMVEANGYAFSTKISGDREGIPVILLHGFPESSAMWSNLMNDLNEKGYYTIAPDQRGYSFSARPEDISQYQIGHLTDDVIGIADALDISQFHLIGHDWGSGVGWQIAAHYPEMLLSFTSLSVPHLEAFSRAYREDSLQYQASNYMRNFQTSKLPEFMLARKNYKLLRSIWSKHQEEEIETYIKLFSQKKALTSAINWYRANYNIISDGVEIGKTKVPTLFIWGNKDKALQRSGAEWSQDYAIGYYRFVEMDASHWLIQESYEDVRKEIFVHLDQFSNY